MIGIEACWLEFNSPQIQRKVDLFDTTDWVFGFYYLGQEERLERTYTFLTENFANNMMQKTFSYLW